MTYCPILGLTDVSQYWRIRPFHL